MKTYRQMKKETFVVRGLHLIYHNNIIVFFSIQINSNPINHINIAHKHHHIASVGFTVRMWRHLPS